MSSQLLAGRSRLDTAKTTLVVALSAGPPWSTQKGLGQLRNNWRAGNDVGCCICHRRTGGGALGLSCDGAQRQAQAACGGGRGLAAAPLAATHWLPSCWRQSTSNRVLQPTGNRLGSASRVSSLLTNTQLAHVRDSYMSSALGCRCQTTHSNNDRLCCADWGGCPSCSCHRLCFADVRGWGLCVCARMTVGFRMATFA